MANQSPAAKSGKRSGKQLYMIGNLFFHYFIQGVFVILIGSILPMMMEEYGLSYRVSGFMLSAHNIGQVITGFLAGVFALSFGLKKSLMVLNSITFIGFAITLVTGNPVFLILGMLMTGLGRGAVSNYSNQVMSEISGGSSALLNALHGFFAIGALLSPVFVLLCTKNNVSGWRITVYVVIALGILSVLTTTRMDTSNLSLSQKRTEKPSFAFLKDGLYLRTTAMMFCYLCVEASIMGWLVTYYTDTGVVSESSTQLLTSLLWVVILVGRFSCTAIGTRIIPASMVRMLSSGILVFLCLLVFSHSLPLMLVATVGLGISMSGMYGTTVANAGDLFGRYPMAMSLFVTITSMGSVITPSIVGAVSQSAGIRMGMTALVVPAVVLVVLAFINSMKMKK